ACAVGLVIAMLFALTVLPAALVLFGRGLFWPYVPRFGSEGSAERGLWFRLGTLVSRKPVIVAILGVLVLGGLSLAVPNVKVGLAQTETFTSVPEAVVGQEIIADRFSDGSGSPTVIVANADSAEDVAAAAETVDGVDSATVIESNDDISRIDVVLDAAAETPAAFETVEALREQVHGIAGADALVGGLDAQALVVSVAQEADQNLVIPLILVLV